MSTSSSSSTSYNNPNITISLRRQLGEASTPYSIVKAAVAYCLSFCCFRTTDLNAIRGRVRCMNLAAKTVAFSTSCCLCLGTLGISVCLCERTPSDQVAPYTSVATVSPLPSPDSPLAGPERQNMD